MDVLLMAHGAPEELSDLPAYYQHIRGGMPIPAEALRRLTARYETLGGPSPLASITRSQAEELQQELMGLGFRARVHVGYLHWHPFIEETLASMRDMGVRDAIALALAPHSCKLGADRYFERAEPLASEYNITLQSIPRWGDDPLFITAVTDRVTDAMYGLIPDETMVIFSAHSLPTRIRSWHDDYEAQVQRSADLTAERCGIPEYTVAWQSAARTSEPWIGPSITETIDEISEEQGINNIIVCPVGFVSDHLEVLYDLGIEVKEHAAKLGLTYRRTASMNASPDFISCLAHLVTAAAK